MVYFVDCMLQLFQIQTYDNLIGPVVESLKYLTSLSLDVLGYCLLEALCTGRGPSGGAAYPPWLQALAAFAGAAFKKHNIELTALLQFVANRLKAHQRYAPFGDFSYTWISLALILDVSVK